MRKETHSPHSQEQQITRSRYQPLSLFIVLSVSCSLFCCCCCSQASHLSPSHPVFQSLSRSPSSQTLVCSLLLITDRFCSSLSSYLLPKSIAFFCSFQRPLLTVTRRLMSNMSLWHAPGGVSFVHDGIHLLLISSPLCVCIC